MTSRYVANRAVPVLYHRLRKLYGWTQRVVIYETPRGPLSVGSSVESSVVLSVDSSVGLSVAEKQKAEAAWRQQHDDTNPTVELRRLLDEALGPLDRSVESVSVESASVEEGERRTRSTSHGKITSTRKSKATPEGRERQRDAAPPTCWRARAHTLELMVVSAALATVGKA